MFLGIALKRLICLVFLVRNIFFYLCDRICTQWLFLLNVFRAAVSVLIGPCCTALLELYLRKCAYCCIIEQIKWWWWWWWTFCCMHPVQNAALCCRCDVAEILGVHIPSLITEIYSWTWRCHDPSGIRPPRSVARADHKRVKPVGGHL